MEAASGFLGIMMIIYIIVFAAATLMNLASYILLSLGMHTIAKRRNISMPWLSWLPFGQSWILGCISDHYRLNARGQQKSKRKILLGTEIAMIVLLGLVMVAYIWMMAGLMVPAMDAYASESAAMTQTFAPLLIMLVLYFVLMGFGIAYTVVYYMAAYDLFKSCNPGTSVLFVLLTIFLPNVVGSLLVFIGRKKDQGMPSVDIPESTEVFQAILQDKTEEL